MRDPYPIASDAIVVLGHESKGVVFEMMTLDG
jgi:hypothetical protein